MLANRVAREVTLPGPHNTPHAGPHGAFHEGEEREILLPQGWRYDTTPSGLFPWRGYLLRVGHCSSLFLRVWPFTLSPHYQGHLATMTRADSCGGLRVGYPSS